AGAVRGGDARRDALGGVDRDGVRGAARVLGVRDHERQVERVGTCRGHGGAQVARGVSDGPCDPLGRRGLGGQDDVGLVLAVLAVRDEHGTPRAQLVEGLLDRREPHEWSSVAGAVSSRRWVYFASTSVSRLTRVPGAAAPSVVTSSVVGMRETPNQSSPTSVTVSETPSTVIAPLRATRRARSRGSSTTTSSQRGPGVRERTVPTPSTWPWTTWPPRRESTRKDRSRLTREPRSSAPSVVCRRGSGMTSAVKVPSPARLVTVRHTAETAIESPGPASEETRGPRTWRRESVPPSSSSTARTSPTSSTIPVNMVLLVLVGLGVGCGGTRRLGWGRRACGRCWGGRCEGGWHRLARGRRDRGSDEQDVGPEAVRLEGLPPHRMVDRGDREVADRARPCTEQDGGEVGVQLVDEPCPDEGRSERRAALDEHVTHLAGVEGREHLGGVVRAHMDELSPGSVQRRACGKVTVPDDDAQRLVRVEGAVRGPCGEARVVGQGRPRAHDDRVDLGAHGVRVRTGLG